MRCEVKNVKFIFIDFSKCVGCRACEIACKKEHGGIKEGKNFIYVFRGVAKINGKPVNVPINCRHCADAPCIKVCPTNALYRDEDGAVLVDSSKCIGCMMCALVCPFGIPELDPASHTMYKCDLCAHRRKRGEIPACVSACRFGALIYGDLSEIQMKRREAVVKELVEQYRIIVPKGEEKPEKPASAGE